MAFNLRWKPLLSLVQLLWLLSLGAGDDRQVSHKFPHLTELAEHSERVHLIGRIGQNSNAIEIEEFVDLKTWNQLLKFKFHPKTSTDNGRFQLSTITVNYLVINEADQPKIYEYHPSTHSCSIHKLSGRDDQQHKIGESNLWKGASRDIANVSRDRVLMQTIEDIVDENSPHSTRFDLAGSRKILLGLAGLWLRARYPGGSQPIELRWVNHQSNRFGHLNPWQSELNLNHLGVNVRYLSKFNDNRKQQGPSEGINMMVIGSHPDHRTLQTLELLEVDLNYSTRLDQGPFQLPIGFNCPENDALHPEKVRLSQPNLMEPTLKEFELVATKYNYNRDGLESTRIAFRSLSLASSRHPLNSIQRVTMIQVHEDKFRSVRDFSQGLKFDIYGKACHISELNMFGLASIESTDKTDLLLENGIKLALDDLVLESLLDPGTKATESPDRLINKIETSRKQLLIYENKAPSVLQEAIEVDRKKGADLDVSLIRVYEEPRISSSSFNSRGRPELSKITLMVFRSTDRSKLLAKIEFNLMKTTSLLELASRAQIFDISTCFDPDEERMQLVVTYPVNSRLLRFASTRSQDVIEAFYEAFLEWLQPDRAEGNIENSDNTVDDLIEQRQLGMSLNFLRMPRIELETNSENDELELHIELLDQVSPLNTFQLFVNTSFPEEGSLDEERFVVSSVAACARMCLVKECRMFAYEQNRDECRLCWWSVYERSDQAPTKLLTPRVGSRVYASRDMNGPARRDASLAQVASQLEHLLQRQLTSGEVNGLDDDEQSENREQNGRGRLKPRSASEGPPRPMSFRLKEPTTAWGPPKSRSLIPSSVQMTRLPVSLDVSRQVQLEHLQSAFKITSHKSRYELNVVDNSDIPEGLRFANERHFRLVSNESNQMTYLSLRKISGLELDECGALCFDTQEFDSQTGSEQICNSYSYCSLMKQCVLAIETGSDYVRSPLELGAREGDVLLELNSIEQLVKVVTGGGCMIARRNLVSGFEGPLQLPPDRMPFRPDIPSQFVELEWLTDLIVSPIQKEHDYINYCAGRCQKRNKLKLTCLAFDQCNQKLGTQIQRCCHQLLWRHSSGSKSQISSEIGRIRNVLYETALSGSSSSGQDTSSSHNENNRKTFELQQVHPISCKRYITAHLAEYRHFKQVRVSSSLRERLHQPSELILGLDVDSCAAECSMIRGECLAFEHCSRLDTSGGVGSAKPLGKLERTCQLFGAVKRSPKSRETPATQGAEDVIQYGNEFSRDCHIYLRQDIGELDNLLNSNQLGNPSDEKDSMSSGHYVGLSFFFLVLYVSAVLVGAIYYKKQIYEKGVGCPSPR